MKILDKILNRAQIFVIPITNLLYTFTIRRSSLSSKIDTFVFAAKFKKIDFDLKI